MMLDSAISAVDDYHLDATSFTNWPSYRHIGSYSYWKKCCRKLAYSSCLTTSISPKLSRQFDSKKSDLLACTKYSAMATMVYSQLANLRSI